MGFCCLSHMCEKCTHKDEREPLTCPHQGTDECEVKKWQDEEMNKWDADPLG